MVSALTVGVYIWGLIANNPNISSPFIVSLPAVILAGVTLLFCLITYIWISPKLIFSASLFIYLLITATTAVLIICSGNIASPFITLWILVSIFASVFGIWGLLPLFMTLCTFTAFQYIYTQQLSMKSIIILISCGLLPLIVSMVIFWRKQPVEVEQTNDDKSFHNIKDKLNEITSKSEIVINAIGDGVIAIDNVGIIKLMNPAAQDIIGWGATDAISLNYKSVLKLLNQNEKSIDTPNDPIGQVLNLNQQVRTNVLGIETKSGKKILISLVVSPIGDPGSGVIAVFHDITKEKTEEREQAEFISTASHEMRTPVASIEGYLGLAMNPQTATVDSRAQDYIQKAHQSAEHLGHLFQDLLDVSKADDGRLPNNPKVINIVNFVHDIVKEYQQKATDKGLRLIYRPIPDEENEKHIAPAYAVNLDNDHIDEIVDNLLDNAIKYTPAGEVSVDVTATEDHIVISIKDSGIGISPEDISHLFQKFYRIDNSDTHEIGGTGLGLYLCRKLAEGMGGRIWAESTKGVGTTFFVELPRVSEQQASIIIEQRTLVEQEKASNNMNSNTTQTATIMPISTPSTGQVMDIIRPANSVPRGQALTPEQIADYVAKQRVLAQQNPRPVQQPTNVQTPLSQRDTRTQTLNIPQRIPRQ